MLMSEQNKLDNIQIYNNTALGEKHVLILKFNAYTKHLNHNVD